MKKILITGFSGFVGRHFLDYLYGKGEECEVLGVDINPPKFDLHGYNEVLKIGFRKMNLLDEQAFEDVIAAFCPDEVLHLASFSSVAYSWRHPAECFNNNTRIFLNLTEALRRHGMESCRVLSVGSSEEYGNVSENMLPLREDMPLTPVSPYAVARVSQEMMSKVLADSYGMQIMLTRSFNHIGPYQDERFVVPSFVQRILCLKKSGNTSGEIETGDVSIVRDFVDVRDVVRAYDMLLERGTPGEVYNIASGRGVRLSEIIEEIGRQVGVRVTSRVNPEFVRPDDNRVIIGSPEKIGRELDWKAEIPLEKTIADMITCMELQ